MCSYDGWLSRAGNATVRDREGHGSVGQLDGKRGGGDNICFYCLCNWIYHYFSLCSYYSNNRYFCCHYCHFGSYG